MHPLYCFCAEIHRLITKTHVSLIVHAKELRRTTNTGRLATLVLENSSLHVRGLKENPLGGDSVLLAGYRPVLFYPSDEAIDLSDFVSDERPVQLIVPDGNWRQASKVQTRYPEFAALPRVKISAKNESTHFLRKETTPEGMATLQAIAEALGYLESRETRDQLMRVYDLKLQRTLQARGVI